MASNPVPSIEPSVIVESVGQDVRRVSDQLRNASSLAKKLGKNHFIGWQRSPSGIGESVLPGLDVVAVRNRWKGSGIGSVENNRFARKGIQAWRANPAVPVTAQVVIPESVRNYENDVHLDVFRPNTSRTPLSPWLI